MTGELRTALLRRPDQERAKWWSFQNPVEQIRADTLDEVPAALVRAEAAARAGRWVVGMIAYDAGPAFDPKLVARRDPTVPLVAFAVFDAASPSDGPRLGPFTVGEWSASSTQDRYRTDVEHIRDRIARGDVYQVNHTIRLEARFEGDAEGFFRALCDAQPARHLARLDFGSTVVCSASPELFLRRRETQLDTRPMKGTRPRDPDPERDLRVAAALVRSEKDRAENTMIVDMARNDLGRIATPGSVTTRQLHTVESYPTVHQLTSTVTARTTASLFEILRATFPPASITGAPKVAATRIIAEREPTPRGIYTGAVGYLEPGGDFVFNVAIRTAWIDRKTSLARYGMGGGIVWDSEPDAEWTEAHDKARVLFDASRPFRLLETMAWPPRAGDPRLNRHLERLAAGARYFGFRVDIEGVRQRVEQIRPPAPVRLRVLVDREGGIELQTKPLHGWPSGPRLIPVPVDVAPVEARSPFLRYKTTRRDRYDAARARFPHAVDVLLWNERKEVTEATTANVVFEVGGQRFTPPVDAGLLPGTLRGELLDRGELTERPLPLAQLSGCDRLWLINSVRGWLEVAVLR